MHQFFVFCGRSKKSQMHSLRGQFATKMQNHSARASGTALLTRVLGITSSTPSVEASDQAPSAAVPAGIA